MCTLLATLNHIIIFSPKWFYIIRWCRLQGGQFSLTAVHSHNIGSFISYKRLQNDGKHSISTFIRTYIKTRRSTWLCFKQERLWVANYVRKCLSVLSTFSVRSGKLGTRNLHMNLFKSILEPVQTCACTCSNLHLNLFKSILEPVQTRTWTCSNLYLNVFKPAHEPVQTCTRTCSNLHLNLFEHL